MSNELQGVVELPAGDTRVPGVVVIQEWWGLNEQIRITAKRWAEEGFIAWLPDLYHGKLAKDADEAGAFMKALDFGAAAKEIAEAVAMLKAHPRCNGKVAVTGYCMGGALSFLSAVNIRGLSAVVPFYGLPGDLDWSKIDAPIQAHFAQHDDWATVAGAQKIKEAVTVPMELHIYDAQHAFCNEKRPEVYNADACRQAWGRAVAFVRAHTA
ncbi:MAG: dienelactone hydrolase family protein [Deltaproteobacteria bacterium]|nr:dienelactone hydrolase family protein [Deltaproteobacteria bacterium]